MHDNLLLSPNPLVQFLGKSPTEFTRNDIIKYVEEEGIEMINLRYAGGDGRLKCLNFVINSRRHLEGILSNGERVDGSSLFKHINTGASDLYVVPKYRTAFLNPFAEIPTLDILCSYYDKDGQPMESSPEYILRKAAKVMKDRTGYEFHCMGELEYYVISEREHSFEATDQRGYHESFPFNKFEEFRTAALYTIASCGGSIKYGHSEVGNFTLADKVYEQNEIEFLPVPVEEAADQLVIAKWILRTMAYNYGVDLTFAPKISVGKAGSGLHVHTKLVRDGKNAMVEQGVLSDVAKRAIAGYLDLAPSLTAFGNTNPTSYFRLVPHQEAPTNICWGDRNRSVLVRVPLGWTGGANMAAHANPQDPDILLDFSERQTVEFRCPDGSADIYLLLAGLTVAARHGIEMEHALEYAKQTYVDVNIFHDEHKERVQTLKQLPASCFESAQQLMDQAEIYTRYGIFSQTMIDGIVQMLNGHNDKTLRDEIHCNKEKLIELVSRFYHCG
jgi:glutamine synthetase